MFFGKSKLRRGQKMVRYDFHMKSGRVFRSDWTKDDGRDITKLLGNPDAYNLRVKNLRINLNEVEIILTKYKTV